MAKVTYVEHNGTEHTVDIEAGQSVMQGAVSNGVPGIDADCGGAAACATCHVFVDEAWTSRVGPATDEHELSMLECAVDAGPASRLSCQIAVSEPLDGLVVHLPESQH